jgi:ectoine hydroxylase-related dioxygenase (phytanoyl-CoA dioxygenase family)
MINNISFTVNEVLSSESARNFFNCFGFVKIKNCFNNNEINFLLNSFDNTYENYFKKSKLNLKKEALFQKKTMMVPNFVDNSPEILNLFLTRKIFDIPKVIIGKDAKYWGSDGSLFAYGSLWHRDVSLKARQAKFNLYLSDGSPSSGAFRIITGSHHIFDSYSQLLQKGCSWPRSAHLGGLSEKGFFPTTINPNSFKAGLSRFINANEIPHIIVPFKKGDLLIFDNRTIHCVYRPFIPKIRRLVTLIFTDYPTNDYKHPALNADLSFSEINKEVMKLKEFEVLNYNVPAVGKLIKDFFIAHNYDSYIDSFKDLYPNNEKAWAGYHKMQSDDLANFLESNFKDES